jgi:hypothetical protein
MENRLRAFASAASRVAAQGVSAAQRAAADARRSATAALGGSPALAVLGQQLTIGGRVFV